MTLVQAVLELQVVRPEKKSLHIPNAAMLVTPVAMTLVILAQDILLADITKTPKKFPSQLAEIIATPVAMILVLLENYRLPARPDIMRHILGELLAETPVMNACMTNVPMLAVVLTPIAVAAHAIAILVMKAIPMSAAATPAKPILVIVAVI